MTEFDLLPEEFEVPDLYDAAKRVIKEMEEQQKTAWYANWEYTVNKNWAADYDGFIVNDRFICLKKYTKAWWEIGPWRSW